MEFSLNFRTDKFYIDFNTGKIHYTDLDTNQEGYVTEPAEIQEVFNLAIVGSRTIQDEAFVKRILNAYKFMFGKPKKVVSGGAKGIDTIGENWAKENNIETLIFLPDWNKYGKRAGFIRNEDIIKNCDICLAIWDGGSNGTKNDFELCEKLGKPLLIFNMKEFKLKTFSGFTYKFYTQQKIKQPGPSKQSLNQSNRWLPQPGIIFL